MNISETLLRLISDRGISKSIPYDKVIVDTLPDGSTAKITLIEKDTALLEINYEYPTTTQTIITTKKLR